MFKIKMGHLINVVVMTGMSVFLVIALFCLNPNDSSLFFYDSTALGVCNPAGVLGAHVSGLLCYLFGSCAYFVLVGLIFLCCAMLSKRFTKREITFLSLLSLFCMLASTLSAAYAKSLIPGFTSGGLMGFSLWTAMSHRMSSKVALALLHVVFVCGAFFLIRFFYCNYVLKGAQKINGIDFSLECLMGLGHKDVNDYSFSFSPSKVHDYQEYTEPITVAPQVQEIEEVHQPDVETPPLTLQERLQAFKTQRTAFVATSTSAMPTIRTTPTSSTYQLPDSNIFIDRNDEVDDRDILNELKECAATLEEKLEHFGIKGSVVEIKRGPVVTLFEYKPEIGSKISKITSLEDDLALALRALSIRIIAPIPGRPVVGFEVANRNRKDVLLASAIKSPLYRNFDGALPLVLGADTVGQGVIVDLARMPHLLIAGSTGSGKSVALNTILVSLLCKCGPDDLKLILIDPKRLEFAPYADIAHLLFPIVTDARKVAPILRWVVTEMENRYEHMAQCGARNIFDYQLLSKQRNDLEKMPFIVVVIDELSDLMMLAGKETEMLITRIAQMARAAGIHMIIATQRPSVDVITGLIKVNFPSRISFRVTSKIDSRTILDGMGAEKLLGRGDMLFLDSGASTLKRVHGAYVSDSEIEQVVHHIRQQRKVEYLEIEDEVVHHGGLSEADNQLYRNVKRYVLKIDEVSISQLQRHFRIGYNRSARIIEKLESDGIILPASGEKMRKVVR